MTYAEFVARLDAALGEDHTTDSDWSAYLPAIVEQAELRCYRDIDFLSVRKTVPATLIANVASFPAPADWLLGQGIRLTLQNAPLDRRDASFLDDYGGVGQPKYWAEPTQGTLKLAPVPQVNYAAELTYHVRPAPLSATVTTTWLSLNCADLMFYAAMVASSGYLKNFGAQADDPRSAMSWEQQYQTALAAVRREEGRRKGDNTFDSSAAPPPSSNLPAGVQG